MNEILKIGNEILKSIKWIGLDNGIAILCSLIGLVGVFLTIQFTRWQFNEDKRIGIKPHLNLIVKNKYCLGDYIVEREMTENFCIDDIYYVHRERLIGNEKSISFFTIELYIENIGLGHALNYKIIDIYGENTETCIMENLAIIKKESESKIYLEIHKHVTTEFISLLDTVNSDNEEKTNILMDEFVANTPYQNIFKHTPVSHLLTNNSKEKIYIDIEYSDLLTNKYKKTFCLELYFDIAINNLDSNYLLDGKVKVLNEESKEIKL